MKSEDHAEQTPSVEEILLEFSFAGEVPTATLLDEFLERFPQYATPLKHLAVQLALKIAADPQQSSEASDWPAADQKSSAVSKALRRVDEQLRIIRGTEDPLSKRSDTGDVTTNPFSHLSRVEMRDFGRRLNASTLFVTRLRDRLIQANTISTGFIQHVAALLDTTYQKVAMHFAAPPQMPAQTSYKADQKPQTGEQQSFAEAIHGSNLTQEQQDYLLKL